MTTEYIWFKGGHPSKHALEESGERPLKVNLGGGRCVYYGYYDNGNVLYESHYKHGIQHRDGDKPAYIKYDQNGNVCVITYVKNCKRHRDGDKPARIKYCSNGEVDFKEYYKNGIQYQPTIKL